MIQVNDTEIYIEAQFFVHKDYSFTGKELLMDIFAENYTNQQIRIYVHDGENLEFSGFLTFIEYIADTFKVPYNHITIESHGPTGIFKNKNLAPGIFLSTGWHIPAFVRDLSNAKFVGTTLGRFNPTRFRLAYEIDCAFPNDNYTVFQPKLTDIERNYRHVTTLYAKELSWIKSKTFDQDMQSPHYSGMIDWQPGCASYPNVWNKYQIEIVSETDALSDFWFTEKTARCLATGKPFVLLAGQNSLLRLQQMGFKTFGTIINEEYDFAKTPTTRIKNLLASLKVLYNSPNRIDKINELYQIANENISLYDNYTQTTKQ